VIAEFDALMQVSLICGLRMESMDWAGIFDTWKSTKKPGGLCLWSWMMIKCIM
jgi:hypothetical protein